MNRECLECNNILHGRADQKFCNDSCRNSYNNRLNSDRSNYMRKVNRILRKNRAILEGLNPKGKSKATKYILQQKGFNFNYFTNVYRTKHGKIYYFCYEQGYLPLDKGEYALVVKKEYVH